MTRHHTPRRPKARSRASGADYVLARRYRRIEMALVGAVAMNSSSPAKRALADARRKAARARGWRGRVAAIEAGAAKVLSPKRLEALRDAEETEIRPDRRDAWVAALEQVIKGKGSVIRL